MQLTIIRDQYKDITFSFKEESLFVCFSINNWIKNKIGTYPRDGGMIGYSYSDEPLNTYILPMISKRGGGIWINAKGELSYRFGIDLKINISTLAKASVAFSNFLDREIQIGIKKSSILNTMNENKNPPIYLSTNDLYMIEDEQFRPDIREEFFIDKALNHVYRNTFSPSKYVRDIFIFHEKNEFTSYRLENKESVKPDCFNSIIGKYIFYLAGHEENRFHYIMSWLATFFQDFSKKSTHTLVLMGKETSGIEILFEEIIKPLFGEQYGVRLNDERLLNSNLSDSINNKLFYNIDNVSNESLSDKNVKKLLKDLTDNDKKVVDVRYKSTIVETKIFGQILVTTNESYLPYINSKNNNYIVFKVQDDIEVNLEPIVATPDNRIKIEKKELVQRIRDDLENFVNILGRYIPPSNLDIKDDKKYISANEEDKLKEFSNAIVNKKVEYFDQLQNNDLDLYEKMMSDFQENKIEQPNIMKCYTAIFGDKSVISSKTLMKKLREIDDVFFATKSIESKSGGKKYFIYH